MPTWEAGHPLGEGGEGEGEGEGEGDGEGAAPRLDVLIEEEEEEDVVEPNTFVNASPRDPTLRRDDAIAVAPANRAPDSFASRRVPMEATIS